MTIGVVTSEWMKTHRRELDRGEADWLAHLACFDAQSGWAADGQLTCVEWLVEHLRMARSTAFEKLQVARILRTRPLVAEAFEQGEISYSAARLLCRVHDPDRDVDQALLELAKHQSIRDLGRAVRTYHAYYDQDRAPDGSKPRPAIRVSRWAEGYVRFEAILPDCGAHEVLAVLRMLTSLAKKAEQESARADDGRSRPTEEGAGRQSARADSEIDTAEPDGAGSDDTSSPDYPEDVELDDPDADTEPDTAPWAAALVDMSRAALAHVGPPATTADRYLVHIMVDEHGHATLPDGEPIPAAVAARIACEASYVVHHQRDGSPLFQGRRTRHWNTAQRRAALVRDGGHCRFPGCTRRTTDLHHHRFWEAGGPTDIDNAVTLCPRHHTLIHEKGFRADGEPNGLLRFRRPDGTPIGTTRPTVRHFPELARAS